MYALMPDLLSTWTSSSPTSPRLTWYGHRSARVELSGRVLATWVVKTTQALDDLAGAATGTRVLLDLPPHWRTLVWALGTWTSGATVVLPDPAGFPAATDGEDVDVVVTHRPERWGDFLASGGVLLAQEMDDLALTWKGDHLRPGVIDAAAEVMGYPDRVDSVPIPSPSDPALVVQDHAVVAFAGLPTWASGLDQTRLLATTHGSGGHPSRVMSSTNSVPVLLGIAVAVYGNGGSLVMVPPQMNDAARQDVAEQEAIGEVW